MSREKRAAIIALVDAAWGGQTGTEAPHDPGHSGGPPRKDPQPRSGEGAGSSKAPGRQAGYARKGPRKPAPLAPPRRKP